MSDLNSEKINVFVSYNWEKNTSLRAFLVAILKNKSNVNVTYDKDLVDYGDEMHEKISDAIDKCHCILVSSESLDASREVEFEIVLGNERGKKILILEDETDPELTSRRNRIASRLTFVNDRRAILYNGPEDLEHKLDQFFDSKTVKDFEFYPKAVRKIQKQIIELHDYKSSSTLKFQSDLVKNILDEADTEISALSKLDYNINVSTEKNFLVRAKPIFAFANEIYAVSLDEVSGFWINPNNIDLAEEYIRAQPKNTVRLFVFSEPKDAHYYRTILEASHRCYGKDGAVLLCSKETYIKWLSNFGDITTNERYTRQDFAILYHGNHSERELKVVEATLDKSELRFNEINIERGQGNLNYKKLINSFKEICNIEKGKHYEVSKNFNIFKWDSSWLDPFDEEGWKMSLKSLFPIASTTDVYHLVFLKGSGDEFERVVLKVKTKLERFKATFGIKEFWFGKTLKSAGIDGKFKGKLKIRQDFNYVFIMRFDSSVHLKTYYELEPHSEVRNEMYKVLARPEMEKLLSFIEKEDDQNQRELFEKVVEELASKYLVRQDFVDGNDINSIVILDSYEFPWRRF